VKNFSELDNQREHRKDFYFFPSDKENLEKMKSWTIAGLLLAAVVAVANGMCAFEHVQSKYCRANFGKYKCIKSIPHTKS